MDTQTHPLLADKVETHSKLSYKKGKNVLQT
jgi:hypothetical protein